MSNFVEDKPDDPKRKDKKWDKKWDNKRDRKKPKPPKKISERYLYNSGLAYLRRFPASSMHFKTVMMRKINKSCRHHVEQNSEDCIKMLDELVIKFQNLGLLDDNAYLKGMITSLRRRGLSAAQIYNKMQQKGYQRDVIALELKKHDLEEYESETNGDIHAALIFARKRKLGPFDILKKRDPEKSLATMARAGYSYDVAKKTLTMDAKDLPDEFKRFV